MSNEFVPDILCAFSATVNRNDKYMFRLPKKNFACETRVLAPAPQSLLLKETNFRVDLFSRVDFSYISREFIFFYMVWMKYKIFETFRDMLSHHQSILKCRKLTKYS